jgi:Ca-activated chloride channel family protein
MRFLFPVLSAMVLGCGVYGQITGWSTVYVKGKVVMEDGSAPPKSAHVERVCSDSDAPYNIAFTDKNGQFLWKRETDFTGDSRRCLLRAVLGKYKSVEYDLPPMDAFSDPNLPPMVLLETHSDNPSDPFAGARVPHNAQTSWDKSQAAVRAGRWAEAEHYLSAAVKVAPQFAGGWNALGVVLERQNKPSAAWPAFKKAIELDPKLLSAYVPFSRLSIEVKDWENAAKVSAELIKRAPPGHYNEAYLMQAIARYQLRDPDAAIASAAEAIKLDATYHRMPTAEYVMGLSLRQKGDIEGARTHLNRFLELSPHSQNKQAITNMIANLGKTPAPGAEADPPPEAVLGLSEVPRGVPGEAWVPGGRKALAQVAGLKDESTYDRFFADYSRALADEETVGTSKGIPEYLTTLRAYMAAVTELLGFGEKKDDTTVITLSLATDGQRKIAEQVLPLLGWRMLSKEGSFAVEPGGLPIDGLRQPIPKLFGVDEVEMQQTLEGGKTFQFRIPTENARVVGGNDWSSILKELPAIPGGIAAAFTQDVRVARAYAGLGAMSGDTAQAVIQSVGVRNLVLNYATVLAHYGEAFDVSKDGVVVPGGPAAEAAWKKIAGASPKDTPAFFRALLQKNEGRLAAFYYALWSADQAHQDYFTKTPERAERFYAWYRDSSEFKVGVYLHVPGWQTDLLKQLPLDASGNLRFPGGRSAWTGSNSPDEEVVTGMKNAEALVPMAAMEQKRGSPLDETSAKLLVANYSQWHSLFPYFEKLPGLKAPEFTSLQTFAAAVSKEAPSSQNEVLGEWYSLVELVVRGAQAGSLDAARSAKAFRDACDGLSGDDHAAKALSTLREIAGGPNLREAVPANLLHLTAERRNAFERVLDLQSVPRVDPSAPAPEPSKAVAALSGLVYAASVDPDALLVSEDPHLVSRHRFVVADANLKAPLAFSPTSLVGSNTPPGSFVQGGFVNFQEIANRLVTGGRSVPPIELRTSAPPAVSADAAAASGASLVSGEAEVTFHSKGRLVEAYATVTDSRGHYVDDLTADQFSIIDLQQAQPLVSFESHATPVSVALLLDTTGSMARALPAVKNAALKLIGDLRQDDSVAVYSFSRDVQELQPFTTDMSQAKRAVLSTHALGETALYDALARVSRDLSGRTGKKVIVVFTDGDDNSSTLTTDIAILRVKAAGVPVYTIAEGQALDNPAYLKQLADVSKTTGGESFSIRDPSEIAGVFEKISEDLSHGYLLQFQPPPGEEHVWRPITVQIHVKGDKVRAREGYYRE